MEKFIIDSYPSSGYVSKVVETTKKNLKEVVNSYFPKKDVRVISTSVGYMNK